MFGLTSNKNLTKRATRSTDLVAFVIKEVNLLMEVLTN
nr:MAG TPA: hypothetical protein [Caudoviricetes sp.]